MTIHAFRTLAFGLLITAVLSLGGCAFGEFRPSDPFDRQLTLDEAQHRYTVLVRFSEFQKARQFVAEDHKEGFYQRMRALKDVHFTGYDSESVELDEEKAKATVRVTYTMYTPTLPYEVEVSEEQEWSRDGMANTWRVVATFEGLQQLVAH